jgi:hypothetical protein
MRSTLRRPAVQMAAGIATVAAAAGGFAASSLGTSVANSTGPAPFAGGPLVALQVGDGATPLSNAASAVQLDWYNADGTAGTSVALPTGDAGGQHALTSVGYSTSEGQISRSDDGRWITVTGYDAQPGATGPTVNGLTESLAATQPSAVSRVIGIVDGNEAVDTSTVLSGGATPQIIRSAATVDGNRFWIGGGTGGVLTTPFGSSANPSVVSNDVTNINGVTIQHAQLFASESEADGVATVGSGTPTSSATITKLPGLPAHALAYGYAFLDETFANFHGTPYDTLYFVDAADRAGAIEKYHWTGSTWTKAGSVAVDGAFGLVATPSGNVDNPTEVALAVSTRDAIWTLTDPDGSNSSDFTPSAGPTQFVTAPAGTEFRGLALAPTQPTGPTVLLRAPTPNKTVAGTSTKLAVTADVWSTLGVSSVAAHVDNLAPVTLANTTGSWTGSVNISHLDAGQHTLSVTAQDGNGHTTTVTRTFTIAPLNVPSGDLGPGTYSFLNSKITHTSGFTTVNFAGSPGGKGLRTTGTGKVTFTYYARSLTLDLGAGPGAGKVKVSIDGATPTVVDLYRSTSQTISQKFGSSKLAAHTVTITAPKLKNSASSGFAVTLGYLVVSK